MKDSKVYFCLRNIDRLIDLKLPEVLHRSVDTIKSSGLEKEKNMTIIKMEMKTTKSNNLDVNTIE